MNADASRRSQPSPVRRGCMVLWPCLCAISALAIGPPGPVEDLKVINITDTEALAQWSPPSFTDGLPVMAYQVSWSAAGQPPASAMVATPSHTLTPLLPDTDYEVVVLAQTIAGFGPASTQVFATLLSPPVITALVADDPEDVDAVVSDGDLIILVFDRDTNRPDVSDTAAVDSLLVWTEPIGQAYHGIWKQDDRLNIRLDDVTGAAPVIGLTRVTLRSGGNLRARDDASPPSTATSPPLSGNWGIPPPDVKAFSQSAEQLLIRHVSATSLTYRLEGLAPEPGSSWQVIDGPFSGSEQTNLHTSAVTTNRSLLLRLVVDNAVP